MIDRQNLKSAATRWGAVAMALAAVLSQSRREAVRLPQCGRRVRADDLQE